MGKIAFVFPGQGAQYPGMGKALYERSQAARRVLDALEAVRPGTLRQCFEGSKEELSQTLNTQPCVFAVDCACAAALQEAGVYPHGAAGFSLGEIAGLAFCGFLDQARAFSLACRRGEFMQRCAQKHPAAMASVLKLSNERVEALCARFESVYPVNYNCPGQLVVAGDAGQVDQLARLAAEQGGRAVKLAVNGAFHSPFMRKARDELETELMHYSFAPPALPLYFNATARPQQEDITALVADHVVRPVLWEQTIRNMIVDGFDTFVETGPGKTLSGLIARIAPEARMLGVSDGGSLDAALRALSGG